MTKTIEFNIEFTVEPKVIYEALLDSETHTKFTEAPAKIKAQENSEFTTFNGMIEGKLTSLKSNSSITMDWRPTAWPEGVTSVVKFSFEKKGNGTMLTFVQTGVPDEAYEMIKSGWEMNYWPKMASLFERIE